MELIYPKQLSDRSQRLMEGDRQMFLHLGENTVIPTQDVVAILDYDVVKKSSAMRRYMAEPQG